MQVESRVTIEKQIIQVTGTESFNVKVNGAGDTIKESPPKRPISVAVCRRKRSLSSIPLLQKQIGLLHRKLCRNRCSCESLNLTLKVQMKCFFYC